MLSLVKGGDHGSVCVSGRVTFTCFIMCEAYAKSLSLTLLSNMKVITCLIAFSSVFLVNSGEVCAGWRYCQH